METLNYHEVTKFLWNTECIIHLYMLLSRVRIFPSLSCIDLAVCSHCASSQSDIYQKEMTHLAQLELKFSKLWRETRLAWMECADILNPDNSSQSPLIVPFITATIQGF